MSKSPRLFEIDPRSLAVFRIMIGALLVVDLAIRATALEAHYTDAGPMPGELVSERYVGTWHWSLHLLAGSYSYQLVLFSVATVAALCLALGYHARIAAVACWVLWASLHTRSPLVLNGGDALVRMLLFWAMFLPLGGKWSIDGRRSVKSSGIAIRSVASAGILIQVCLMYWMTGYFKIAGPWPDGTELTRILHYDSYARPLAYVLRDFPTLVATSGMAVVALELIGPILLLIPFRSWLVRGAVIAAFGLLHVGIELTLTVGMFSYVCWTALLLFVPSGLWDALARRGHSSFALRNLAEEHETVSRRLATSSVAVQVLLIAVIVYVTCWNISGMRLVDGRLRIPDAARPFGELLFLHQDWRLFDRAPSPDGWYVVVARLQDERAVDLMRDGAEADWDSFTRPKYTYRRFPNHRWRKFYQRLLDENSSAYREPLCRYLAARWNDRHDNDARAVRIELEYMEEMNDRADSDTYMQRSLHAVDVPKKGRSRAAAP